MRRTLALLVLLSACKTDPSEPADNGGAADGTDGTDTHDPGGQDDMTVGPDGGQIDLGGGATLDIPAGALTEDVEITATVITDLEGWADAPTFTDGVRFALSLEPHGLTFAEPATLTLPHGGWDDRLAVMRTDDDDDDTSWEVVPGMAEAGADAVVQISGFSGYALVTVADGSS
jgi:hypothetical protein